MKKLFVLALSALCFAVLMSVSQWLGAAPLGKSDPKAKALLDKVSQKFKASKTLKADFTLQTIVPDQKNAQKQAGKIYIKGNKYKITTTEIERFSDGKTVWTLFKTEDEVQVNNVSPTGGELTPAQFFTMYQKGFTYSIHSNNDKAMEIDLVPTDKNSSYFKVRLNINKLNNQISAGTVFEKSGVRLSYTLQNQQANTPMEDAFFGFNPAKYPNVEVIDLR